MIVLGPLPQISLVGISLPTYFVFMSFVLIGLVYYTLRRSDQKDFSGATALDLFLNCLMGGFIGARLLHIFYEEPTYYLQNPLEIFYFWQGGFVYYGGLLGAFLTGAWTLKKKQQPLAPWLDFFAPIGSLGYALGRIACFLVGCCYGRTCDLPWAYSFTQINSLTNATSLVSRHPTQLYSFLLELINFLWLLQAEKKRIFSKKPGALFAFWILLHSLQRIFIELFRDDPRGAQWGVLSISIVLSILFLVMSVHFLWKNIVSK